MSTQPDTEIETKLQQLQADLDHIKHILGLNRQTDQVTGQVHYQERLPFFPLLALVETWRQKANQSNAACQDAIKNQNNLELNRHRARAMAYSEAAESLEKWIKLGTLTLES